MIDRALLKNLRVDIDAALAAVGEKHGVVLSAGNASFERDGSHGNFKLAVSSISKTGFVETKEAAAFKLNAINFHMKLEDLGEEFSTPAGEKFVLIGVRPRSKTAALLATRTEDGRLCALPLRSFPGASCIGYQ
jgi:hypothetical protein